ncbi:MAG: CPBP family glutamic-type intramembrane protease [Pseudomonadota bacterium]
MNLFRTPRPRAWIDAGFIALGFIGLAVPFGMLTGFYNWAPSHASSALLRFALIAFILPALLEELVFRGPILVLQNRNGHAPLWAMALSLIAFIAWHPINTVMFMPQAADTFRDWRFLTLAALIGVATTLMTLRSRSLWPAVLFHWGVVVAWKALLGAPGFL